MVRSYKAEAAQTPELVGAGVGFADLVKAATIAAGALVIVSGGLSLLVWGSVWVKLCIGSALVPYVILAAAMLLWLRRGVLWALEGMTGLDLDGDGMAGQPEQIRLIPVRAAGSLIDGVPARDLRYFIEVIARTGDWSVRRWEGCTMPSGVRLDREGHAAMIAILKKAGLLVGHGERSSGQLVTSDASEILRRLGL